MTTDTTTITCSWCAVERPTRLAANGEGKLPRQWKRRPSGEPSCPDCWRKHYVLRAITFPVASPLEQSWGDLRTALKSCFNASTTAANLIIHELLKADVVRTPDMEKLPAMPTPYLYPAVREAIPDLEPSSAISLIQAVTAKYRARRFEAIWLRKEAPPSFRYPMPYPVHNKAWKARFGTDHEPLVSVRLGGMRWTMRLRGGQMFRRQLAAFEQIVSRATVQGELAFYEIPAHYGDNRPSSSHNGDGASACSRLMVKLVAWIPKKEAGAQEGVLSVTGTTDTFLTCEVNGDGTRWGPINADWMRSTIVGHEKALQRLREDLKFEKRFPASQRQALYRRLASVSHNQRKRLQTFIHQVTLQIAERARRSRVSMVTLDLEKADFMPHFPWFQFTTALQSKLDERSIRLHLVGASGSRAQEKEDPLAE